MSFVRRKRKLSFRKKRLLDTNVEIDYKQPDLLKRFITDRGKIIPRRVSGASAMQQRLITKEVKRARYLALLPFSVAHLQEKDVAVEAALQMMASSSRRTTGYSAGQSSVSEADKGVEVKAEEQVVSDEEQSGSEE